MIHDWETIVLHINITVLQLQYTHYWEINWIYNNLKNGNGENICERKKLNDSQQAEAISQPHKNNQQGLNSPYGVQVTNDNEEC